MVDFIISIVEKIQQYALNNYTNWIGIFVMLFFGYWIIKFTRNWIAKIFTKVEWDRSLETFIGNSTGVVMWSILIIMALSRIGIDISGFVAGLGIMGFIAGFAIKDTISNFVSGVFILSQKPFKIGDKIRVHKTVEGTVKEMGMSTCTLISDNQEHITIPNSLIWGEAIYNLSRLKNGKKIEERKAEGEKEEKEEND